MTESTTEIVAESSDWHREQTAHGLLVLALAAVIMGSWRPQWAVAACLLFGSAEAIQLQLEAAGIKIEINNIDRTLYYDKRPAGETVATR